MQVQVRDDEEIDDFLKVLVDNTKDPKVNAILALKECTSFGLSILKGDALTKELDTLKNSYKADSKRNQILSDWLDAAEKSGLYPQCDSKDQTDDVATAETHTPTPE